MSKRNNTTSIPPEAAQREALINGNGKEHKERRATSEFVSITERHGQRLLRLARISQVIEDRGQVGGPWFLRCDGQQLVVSEENARLILKLLGLSMEGSKS